MYKITSIGQLNSMRLKFTCKYCLRSMQLDILCMSVFDALVHIACPKEDEELIENSLCSKQNSVLAFHQ